MMKKIPQTVVILICMAVGIATGAIINNTVTDPDQIKEISSYFSMLSDIFLTLIKMIIAPLVFSTLVVGIAHMGDASSVGRIFFKSLAWFLSASLFSLLLGLIFDNIMQPGASLNLTPPDAHLSANLATSEFTLQDFIKHLIPKSFADAMAKNEILQIVVFSMFFGIAMASIGEKAKYL
jgi:Na+/H+-dicarboxylate symporter